MIGNDIIDLNELQRHPRSDQLRFRRKILAEPELDWLSSSGNAVLDIWKLWALKESAYKCYFQLTRRRFFSPRKFICQWETPAGNDPRRATVVTPIGWLQAEIDQTEDYIHALCSDEAERLAKAKVQLVALPERDARAQSGILRREALTWIAQHQGHPAGELSWDDAAGHPRVKRRGVLLPVSISLSHHGRWGAAAFLQGPGSLHGVRS